MSFFPKRRRKGRISIWGGILLLLAGCQTVQPAKTAREMASLPEPKVVLGPGDVLEVKFFYAPELNESQTVRPDGKITLQLIGDVEVQGKTPAELKSGLVRFYSGQLRQPEIAVIVRSLYRWRVFVGGEVRNPVLLPYSGPITALEAVMQAGGLNPQTAEPRNILVIRQREGRYFGTALDFSGALLGKEGSSFFLEPNDIVYVPRTVIANINQWVDQYISKMVPPIGLFYSTPLGGGSMGIDLRAR